MALLVRAKLVNLDNKGSRATLHWGIWALLSAAVQTRPVEMDIWNLGSLPFV